MSRNKGTAVIRIHSCQVLEAVELLRILLRLVSVRKDGRARERVRRMSVFAKNGCANVRINKRLSEGNW
jgi:hypothetical protein